MRSIVEQFCKELRFKLFCSTYLHIVYNKKVQAVPPAPCAVKSLIYHLYVYILLVLHLNTTTRVRTYIRVKNALACNSRLNLLFTDWRNESYFFTCCTLLFLFLYCRMLPLLKRMHTMYLLTYLYYNIIHLYVYKCGYKSIRCSYICKCTYKISLLLDNLCILKTIALSHMIEYTYVCMYNEHWNK